MQLPEDLKRLAVEIEVLKVLSKAETLKKFQDQKKPNSVDRQITVRSQA
jgi:hypothetical protein